MWLVALNPTAGRGKGAAVGQQVTNYLSERKINYRIVTGSSPQSLAENLEDQATIASGILAVGGDGLNHLAIQCAVKHQLPLATIPAGTGNDFVRALGWNPDRPLEVVWKAINEEPTRIDLGNVDGEYFGAVLSTGFDSLVNERANRLIWPKGPAKYNLSIAIELPKFKPRQYRIKLDGVTMERNAMLIAVANGTSYGGGMMVCPNADFNDGLFDIMVLNPISKREFVRIFPTVYEGKHINNPAVEIFKAKRVEIEADAICYADGERVGPAPANAIVAEGALLTWTS